jgi:excisionase family DNA binding protein
MRTIPAPILTAATGMLSPFFPNLTATRLVEALNASSDPRRPAPLPESLTKAEVCAVGKCSLATVNRWLRRGQLPSTKVGRLVRIPRAAVEALLTPAVPGVEVV